MNTDPLNSTQRVSLESALAREIRSPSHTACGFRARLDDPKDPQARLARKLVRKLRPLGLDVWLIQNVWLAGTAGDELRLRARNRIKNTALPLRRAADRATEKRHQVASAMLDLIDNGHETADLPAIDPAKFGEREDRARAALRAQGGEYMWKFNPQQLGRIASPRVGPFVPLATLAQVRSSLRKRGIAIGLPTLAALNYVATGRTASVPALHRQLKRLAAEYPAIFA